MPLAIFVFPNPSTLVIIFRTIRYMPPMETYEPREAKTIRQACVPAVGTQYQPLGPTELSSNELLRRKKIKCTGQRTMCFFCRRNRHTCVYEPYSATISERRDSPARENARGPPREEAIDNVLRPVSYLQSVFSHQLPLLQTELLQRLITIEKRLADLGQQGQRHIEYVIPRAQS